MRAEANEPFSEQGDGILVAKHSEMLWLSSLKEVIFLAWVSCILARVQVLRIQEKLDMGYRTGGLTKMSNEERDTSHQLVIYYFNINLNICID